MLFASAPQEIAPDVWLLHGFASGKPLREGIAAIAAAAAFRHLVVPSGQPMAVAMTNCGPLGWTSSSQGYRYLPHDPDTLLPWPAMPEAFSALAHEAAASAGWPAFAPDACLVNRYAPGAGLGLHQDRDENDLRAPIVSVSIGASCKFILGGLQRSSPVQSFALHDGDVMVWGGRSRLVYHGVRPLPKDSGSRYNLTFRKAAESAV
jgi:DNA oxidative demethylase